MFDNIDDIIDSFVGSVGLLSYSTEPFTMLQPVHGANEFIITLLFMVFWSCSVIFLCSVVFRMGIGNAIDL